MFGVRPPGIAGSKPSYRSPPGKLAFFTNIYNDPFQWSFVKSVIGFGSGILVARLITEELNAVANAI
uniref:Uncharacterized protein n=1 Tax=Globodera rostochiensis TaxID=31243 RepID=A0A914ICT6_GLORO